MSVVAATFLSKNVSFSDYIHACLQFAKQAADSNTITALRLWNLDGRSSGALHEKNLKSKFIDLALVLLGMLFLYIGSHWHDTLQDDFKQQQVFEINIKTTILILLFKVNVLNLQSVIRIKILWLRIFLKV